MSWYNPISWFKKTGLAEKLVCDNPYCSGEILERKVLYNRERDRVYHDEDCARVDMAFLAVQSSEHVYGSTEHISRKRVINIRRVKGLENHVSE